MTSTETVREIIGQIIDATGNPDRAGAPDDATLAALADRLPSDAEEWGEREWSLIDEAWEAHTAAHRAAADEVRRSCQMTGSAMVGQTRVIPDGEFVCHTGSEEVRARQLRDWPSSPHWSVDLVAPDGETDTVTGAEASSWAQLLTLAREADAAWQARVAADLARRRARLDRARAAQRDAERALDGADAEVAAARAALPEIAEQVSEASPAEVAALRHALGLSGDQMAAMLGVNPRTVRSWESGRDGLSATAQAAVWALARRHDDLVSEMLTAEVPVVIRREQSAGDVPPRGWFLAAAGRALLEDPDVSIDWA